MKYSLLILVALAGCTTEENYPPNLTAAPDSTGMTFIVTYQRGSGHDYSGLKGTVNGIDLGPADISEGGPAQQVTSSPIPASAVWQMDPAKIGGSAHVVIDDGGEEFTLDETINGQSVVVTGCSSNLTC
jgi:hypothetical protein